MKNSIIHALKSSDKTQTGDERYTPDEAIIPLLKYLPKDKIIYECTSQNSFNIYNTLWNNGYQCKASRNINFLTDKLPIFDIIVTNPPYSQKDQFIQKCYELKKPFALLLPLSTLGGKKRGDLFEKFGIDVLVFKQRVNFTKDNNPHFHTAWFCYKILPNTLIFEDIK